jgi:ribonuclease BN (tRNA processing enzyme)
MAPFLSIAFRLALSVLASIAALSAHAAGCEAQGVQLQVLGSGGPELDDGRASSAYLVWQDGRARLLVDLGSGSLLNFEHSGARVEDLDMILLTHMHVDHVADLPALIKASYFTGRSRDLPLFGPSGNLLMPGTTMLARALFGGEQGAFRYLSDYLDGGEAYRLLPRTLDARGRAQQEVWKRDDLRLVTVPVHHGPIPALAWRVELGGKVLVFSGDMNGDNATLPGLAKDADLLVAHHAVPESAKGAARKLHMPPSVIGDIAAEARVKQLLLSHRMNRTLGREKESAAIIRKRYSGPLAFVEDGQCFKP